MKNSVITVPKLRFKQDGTPISEQFNDIYFDSESGYQQSEQVFIRGNNLYQRLAQSSKHFIIGETGFGTGLNFLLTLQAYQKLIANAPNDTNTTVEFISIEKYPLTKMQLCKSLKALPQLQHYADLLLAQYPEFVSSNKVLNEYSLSFFDNQVRLKIIIDDAAAGLAKIPSEKSGVMDAWYLDGFAPAKINNQQNITLWGDGTPLREFLHVKDLAKAVLFAIENKLPEPIYNVGSGKEISIKHLAKLIQEIVGYQGEIVWDDSFPNGTPRKLLDVSKMNLLGWKANIELKKGISSTYEWYLKNTESVKKVSIV